MTLLEAQVGHAEEGFAEETSADAGRDLIVLRGRRRLSGDLPQDAADERIAQRFPKV